MNSKTRYFPCIRKTRIYVFVISFCIFFTYTVSYGSQESYLKNINFLTENSKPIQGIIEYNKQKKEEIDSFRILFSSQVGDTNFASIRVFYRKKGTEKFDWMDIPKSVFFVSTELKIGDSIIVSQWKEENNNERLVRSYERRENIVDFRKLENGKYSLDLVKVANGKPLKKNKTFFPIKNLYRWHEYNPLYPDLIHSEQQFLNYCLLNEYPSVITTNQIDCILINIVSINAACEYCFTALDTFINGKNDLKKDFIKKMFPNTSTDVPMHILYQTVSNTSMHRGVQRSLLKKQPQINIDLADKKIHFINIDSDSLLPSIVQEKPIPKKEIEKKDLKISQLQVELELELKKTKII